MKPAPISAIRHVDVNANSLDKASRVGCTLHDQRTRFILIGIWNTVVGYSAFVIVHLFAGQRLNAIGTLFVAYAISLPHAFLTQRLVVFHTTHYWFPQFLRFASANSVIFLANLAFLPVVIAATGTNPLFVQAGFVALSTLANYLAHKHFSFAG